MLLLVLRCLAVYGAAAALALWAAHRWIVPIRARIGLVIAVAPLLFTGRAVWTAGVYAPVDLLFHNEPFASGRVELGMTRVQTPLLSDVVSSMIPWQQAVRDAVADGRFPLWNPSVLAGEPLLAVQQAGTFHPGTWIGLLLPAPQAWTFQMSLRLLLALLSAYLFFRDLGCRDAAALLGAAAWGFSDFLIFYLGYPVATAIGPFPLLLLGLSRLVKDADRRAVLLTVVALVLIVTAGHPETLLFAVCGAGVYFLFLLAWAGRGRRLRPFLLSLAAGAAALGLTAVQLLPLAEVIPRTWEHAFRSAWFAHVKKSVTLVESARRAVPILVPYAYGESGHGQLWKDFGVPAAYGGSILFPLAIAGLASRHRLRWPLLLLGALGAALWARLAGVTDVLAKLPLFDIGVLEYFVFLAAFSLAALAALGAEELCQGRGATAFLIGAAGTGLAIGFLFRFRALGMEALGMSDAFLRERLLCALVPLLLGAVVVLSVRAGPRVRWAAAALLPLLLLPRVVEAGAVYPTYPASAFYPRLPPLEHIPRGAPDRFVATGYLLIPNAAALYGLEDARGYESMTLRPLYETFPLWCRLLPVWYNRVDDLTRPFLSFLNVRYALVPEGTPPPDGWRLLAASRGADVLENTRALPRAFAPASIRHEPDGARRMEALGAITDFGERGVLASSPSGSATDWAPNGRATVRIAVYRPQSMSLEIDAQDDTVIATSVPAWPGWKARIDGKSVPALSYNHAFLAYPVPKGRHRLDLRYLPDGFVAGSIISVLTLVVTVAASRRRRDLRWARSHPTR